MNLKEATHKCLNEVLNDNFKNSIIDAGFIYLEKQSIFKIENGDFKCEISLKPEIDRIYLQKEDEVRFNLSIQVAYFSSKFRTWFKKNLEGLPQKITFLYFHERFLIYDKHFDTNNSNETELKKIEDFILNKVISVFKIYNDWDNVVANYDEIKNNIDLEDIYLFLDKKSEASKILHEKRKTFLANEEIVSRFSYLIDHVNLKLSKLLGEEIKNPSINITKESQDKIYELDNEYSLKSDYVLKNLPKNTHIVLSSSGEFFISIHDSGIGILWSIEGKMLYEKKLNNKQIESAYTEIKAGFIEEFNLWYLDQNFYSLTDGSSLFKLELNDEKKKTKQLRFHYLHYLKGKELIFAVFDKLSTGVFDKKGEFLYRFVPKGDIVNVRQSSNELLVYSDKNYYFITPNNDVNSELNNISNNRLHVFNNDETLFFTGGYYTKQYLYDLVSNNKQTIWAHPTHNAEYKALFHNVCNNFGCNSMTFSSDNKKIALSADHGRNSVFMIPKLERIELNSRELFGYRWETTEFSYGIKSMAFYRSNLLFTTIENNLVVWGENGNSILKIDNIAEMNLYEQKGYLLCVDKSNNIIKFNMEV